MGGGSSVPRPAVFNFAHARDAIRINQKKLSDDQVCFGHSPTVGTLYHLTKHLKNPVDQSHPSDGVPCEFQEG